MFTLIKDDTPSLQAIRLKLRFKALSVRHGLRPHPIAPPSSMKAYRYLASHWIDTLRDKRFKLAKPSELNDPFDCVMAYKGLPPPTEVMCLAQRLLDDHERRALEAGVPLKTIEKNRRAELKRKIQFARAQYPISASLISRQRMVADETTRLLCMSAVLEVMKPRDHLHEVLMWSHYAYNHRGIRIGIDLTHINKRRLGVEPVDYSPKRPICDLSVGLKGNALLESIKTKSQAWNYENELRLWTMPKHCITATLDSGQSAEFLPFNPDLIFRIDLGLNMPEPEQHECMNLIIHDYPHVELYKAKYHPKRYSLVYEQIYPVENQKTAQ